MTKQQWEKEIERWRAILIMTKRIVLLECYKDGRKVAEMDVTDLSFQELDYVLEIQGMLGRVFKLFRVKVYGNRREKEN